MARLRLEVSGDVQGVGFRWFARETARRLDLAGWVRNRPDGSVEIAIEGEDVRVEQFIGHLARGPTGAQVADVARRPLDDGEALSRPFTILR